MMMQAVVLQGEASNDSGLVKLAGFITNSGDISKKCEEVFPPDSGWRKLGTWRRRFDGTLRARSSWAC